MALSAGAGVCGAAIIATGVVPRFVQAGPYSDLHVTLMAVGTVWLLCGAIAAAAAILPEHTAERCIAAAVVGIAYANVMREAAIAGDASDYVDAALRLYHRLALPARYLYAPLWATLLSLAAPLGERALHDICWQLNAAAVPVFVLLLSAALERYGHERRRAIALACAFTLVNVAVLRTLVYGQINLHAMNAILAAIVLYPRYRPLSALALALAVHLKLSPLLLVAAFAVVDAAWMAWWCAAMVLLALPTLFLMGVTPFLDVWRNLSHVYGANGLTFRDTSVDSFVHAASLLPAFGWMGRWTIVSVKVAAVVAGALLVRRHVAGARFVPREAAGAKPLNALPALMVLMLLLSPLLWEHHPVFAALSFLLLPCRSWRARDWGLFTVLYAVVFLVPTFDVFPLSYGRLVALAAWMPLAAIDVSRPGATEGTPPA